MYTTAQNVRDLLGVDIDTADDSILEEFIDYAQIIVRKYIQINVIDGIATGNLDGVNNTFQLEHAYVADKTGNLRITPADFTVWGWKKSDDPFTRDQLTVSTFDPLRSLIVLSTPPDPDVYEDITCDYAYYTKAVDWDLLALATAWKAAELWVKREEFLVPELVVFSGRRILQRQPWKYFEIEFTRIIDKIVALPMTKVRYAKLVFRPRGPEGPEVDTSAAKEIQSESVYSPDPEIEKIVDNAEN